MHLHSSNGKWEASTVEQKEETHLSYIIEIPEGAMLRQGEIKQNAKCKGYYS